MPDEAQPASSQGEDDSPPSHGAPLAGAAAPLPGEPASYRRRRGGGRLARRRMLPWSERSVLAVSLLLVLLSTPLWIDPSALYELGWGGRPSPGGDAATTAPALPRPTTPAATPGVPARVIASDTFSRRLADGWGSAEAGGRYVLDGTGQLAVEPGVGLVRVAAGDAGSVALAGAQAQDVSLDLSVAFDELPAGDGELRLYAELRRTERGGAYRPVIHLRADGSLLVGATLRLGGREQELGTTYRVPNVSVAAGDVLRLRAEALGSAPTTVRLRVWPAGSPEPTFWHVSVIDWSGALQDAGGAGLGWRLESAASTSLTLRIDDLSITTTDGGESQ